MSATPVTRLANRLETWFLALLLVIAPACARAAPPPAGSADAKEMAPYRDWFVNAKGHGGGDCCGDGDGRPVDADIIGGHWVAHITPGHWSDITRSFDLVVPDDKVVPKGNPTGRAVIWLSQPHKSHQSGTTQYMGGYPIDDGPDDAQMPTVYCFYPPTQG